jgi:hypothetical protein
VLYLVLAAVFRGGIIQDKYLHCFFLFPFVFNLNGYSNSISPQNCKIASFTSASNNNEKAFKKRKKMKDAIKLNKQIYKYQFYFAIFL